MTLTFDYSKPLLNLLVGRGIACFFISCIIGRIYRCKESLNQVGIGCLAFGFVIVSVILSVFIGYSILYDVRLYFTIVMGSSIIISALFLPAIRTLFSLKPFVLLGSISTSIFMWHFPIQILLEIINVYGNTDIDLSKGYI